MSIRHLYSSHVEAFRLTTEITSGAATVYWEKVNEILDSILGVPGELLCRLDLMFFRPGKDQPMPVLSSSAPDRTGVMFCDYPTLLKAGDRLKTVSGPIVGTFEVRTIPDVVQGYGVGHHVEIPIVEVAQEITNIYPGNI